MNDEVMITETEAFRPRFKNLSQEFDRLLEHLVELLHQQRITPVTGRSLADYYGGPTMNRIRNAYFDRKLYAEIEDYYTYTFEIAFSPPHDGMVEAMDRLIDEGQGNRVIRIWRNYLAHMKKPFWHRIDSRKRGFKMYPNWLESEAVQRASYENLIEAIPHYKAGLLAMIDDARATFVRAGANEATLSRLAAERAEIEAEERQRVRGKPDPRAMDDEVFWEIIGSPDENGTAQQIDEMADRLARFKPAAIKAFDIYLQDLNSRAYRSDVWALAYLLNEGSSDDDFADFRCWLILQGKDVFEDALRAPDTFDVALASSGTGGCLSLLDVPLLAYEMRSGKPMRRKKMPPLRLQGPDLEEDDFEEHLPRVAEALQA